MMMVIHAALSRIISIYLHITCVLISEVLVSFEAWAKLAQKWLVCAPLGIHLEPINKALMLLVTI